MLMAATPRAGASSNDGKVLWQVSGNDGTLRRDGRVLNVAGPTVVLYSTGEPMGESATVAAQIWSADVAGSRSAAPSRCFVRYDRRSGHRRRWRRHQLTGTAASGSATGAQRNGPPGDGASSPVLVAGNSVFMVNDQAQLVRLDASNGGRVWAQKLPHFTGQAVRKQSKVWEPLRAGSVRGKLYVASSGWLSAGSDPAWGALIGTLRSWRWRGCRPGRGRARPFTSSAMTAS